MLEYLVCGEKLGTFFIFFCLVPLYLHSPPLVVTCNLNSDAYFQEGVSPLTVAVQEDHVEVAEFLLKKGANVNILDRHRRSDNKNSDTLLVHLNSPLVKRLYLCTVHKTYRSPLMIAAGNGYFDMVRLLLKFRANVELKDSKGHSAQDYAELEYHDT